MDGSQDNEVLDHFPPNETKVQREGARLLFSGRFTLLVKLWLGNQTIVTKALVQTQTLVTNHTSDLG